MHFQRTTKTCPWCEAKSDNHPVVRNFNGSDDALFCKRCGRWIVTDGKEVWRRAVASERYMLRKNPEGEAIRAAFVRGRNLARKPE